MTIPRHRPPSIAMFQQKVTIFNQLRRPDKSLVAFRRQIGTSLDLSLEGHNRAMHRWLNAWSCRIPYPEAGSSDTFHFALSGWWTQWAETSLLTVDSSIASVSNNEIDVLAAGFRELARLDVGNNSRRRRLGPTAAAKCLYALRPRAVVAWDHKIALTLHGARDADAFARHLQLGREWAQALLAEASVNEEEFSAVVERPNSTFAKLLDEYWYVTITLGR